MAIDGLDSRFGSEMGLTCKHEFQSWSCVDSTSTKSTKIENDLHKPHANPTSQKVNNVEEKTLANTEPQTPPLKTVNKTLKT